VFLQLVVMLLGKVGCSDW